jgi:Iron-containing redox enzyme
MTVFELPDTIAALPRRPFEFSPAAADEAAAILASPPDALFHRLLRDQESQAPLLAARRILHAFLSTKQPEDPGDADTIAVHVAQVRTDLAKTITTLRGSGILAAQRAPISLLSGCWLDVVSQAATQPSIIVNRLYAQYFTLRGADNPLHSIHQTRRRALEAIDVDLPEIGAADFLAKAQARPLTALHASFYLALSRLPANFLPEVVGVHYVFHALGIDDLLLETPPPLEEPQLREVLAEYLTLAGPDERRRLGAAIELTLALESEHVAMLADLAAWRDGLSLESKVAEIVARHAPMAGNQHRNVRVSGRLLADTFTDPDLDIAAFLADLRESRLVQPSHGEHTSRFIRAMKFGGPMFGIFTEAEADVFKAWVRSVQEGERPEIEIETNAVGDNEAERWRAYIAASAPSDVVTADARPHDHRELFHRLVNIENFPNTLPIAAERAARTLDDAEVLFVHGAGGRYTDATYFDYTPEALYERCERVYWDKLIKPYKPLTEIPDRDVVVFLQTTYALGALIDGTWLHRLGNLGHRERPSDAMLFSIYADEMGHGDLRKNHLTLIHTALGSMDVRLPHIRDEAFMEQAELPDDLYGFSLHQLCLALFPDRFYNELLGYNLAIEMFGLGELRLHEMQKLRHYQFDDCYEKAHLAIDNFSAGHTKQAADIIVSYLDGVQRTVGDAIVQQEWRRIWRGYASYAYFVEHTLLKELATDELADIVI